MECEWALAMLMLQLTNVSLAINYRIAIAVMIERCEHGGIISAKYEVVSV